MASVPHSVSLDDIPATRDELEALKNVLRSDSPYPDEPPELDDEWWPEPELCLMPSGDWGVP